MVGAFLFAMTMEQINALANERQQLWLKAGRQPYPLSLSELQRIDKITHKLARLWQRRGKCSDYWCCGYHERRAA